jgi:hypothetical protein
LAGPLEAALAQTEADAIASAKAADTVGRAAKRLAAAAKTGNLADIEKTMSEADKALQALRQQFTNTREGWTFDASAYTDEGGLRDEIMEAAERMGLKIYQQDDRLFSYPVLLRINPARSNRDITIEIDRKKTRAIRPSYIVRQLLASRDRPQRFRARDFLDSIHKAYVLLVKEAGPQSNLASIGPSIQLHRIYETLTLFPGQSREYSPQEFARDLYLLDKSGTTETSRGQVVDWSPARGASTPRQFKIVDEHGRERSYYSVAFKRGSS